MSGDAPLRGSWWRWPLAVAVCIGLLGVAVVLMPRARTAAATAPPAPAGTPPSAAFPPNIRVDAPLPQRWAEPPAAEPPGSARARAAAAEVALGLSSLRGRWLRGFRMVGGPLTVGTHPWLGQIDGMAAGVRVLSGGIAAGVTGGAGASDPASFLNSGLAGHGDNLHLVIPVPPGDTLAYLVLAYEVPISTATLQVLVSGRMAPLPTLAGHGSTWCCVGPLTVHGAGGVADLQLRGMGAAVLCGIALTAP